MAEAFQCDRCGDFEHGKPAAGVDVRGSLTPGVTKKHDLCAPCLADLHDWLAAGAPNLDHPEESHHDARY